MKYSYYLSMHEQIKSEANAKIESRPEIPEHEFGSDSKLPQEQFESSPSDQISHYHSEFVEAKPFDTEGITKEEKQAKLYVLLIKFKLEELGFRKYEYADYLEGLQIKGINCQQINIDLTTITEKILANSQQKRSSPISSSKTVRVRQIKKLNRIELFVCPVCCQPAYQSQFAQYLQCGHKFCDDCITSTIEQNIDQAKYNSQCLELDCMHPISIVVFERCLTLQKFERFLRLKSKHEIQTNPNNKFCTKTNCDGILLGQASGFVCPKCQATYCETCLRQAHDGDCESRIQQHIEQVYLQLKIKKCPKCKSPIEKSEGCNHMTCKKCCHEFCWICLSTYSKFHYRYYNCFGCPGMQFEQQQDKYKERLKQVIFFLLLPCIVVSTIALVLLGLPIYMILIMVTKPYQKAMESTYNTSCINCQCCCCDDSQDDPQQWSLCCFLLYWIYLPYGIFYSICLSPFKYLVIVYHEIQEVFE